MPILVLIGDLPQMRSLVRDVPATAQKLIERFWPGPLTIVLPAASGLPPALTAGTGTIGIRWPAYPPIRTVLQRVGPMTGTSANVTGTPALMTAQAVDATFGGALDLILDAPVGGGLPSTVINAVGDLRMIREGTIRFEEIAAAMRPLGVTVQGGRR
jgi:L-threonylcarbamoyladenylate synthase